MKRITLKYYVGDKVWMILRGSKNYSPSYKYHAETFCISRITIESVEYGWKPNVYYDLRNLTTGRYIRVDDLEIEDFRKWPKSSKTFL